MMDWLALVAVASTVLLLGRYERMLVGKLYYISL